MIHFRFQQKPSGSKLSVIFGTGGAFLNKQRREETFAKEFAIISHLFIRIGGNCEILEKREG
jgi:hypothetical protein